MTSEDYQAKVERRRDRLQARADKAAAKSQAAAMAERAILDHIPMGQPILVGHHSEKRHRRDLDKAARHIRTAIDENRKAENLQRRAEAVGTGGISSDDPNAPALITAWLAAAEEQRAEIRRLNAVHRKGGWEAVAADIGVDAAAHLKRNASYTADDVPYPSYHSKNLSGNIRRMRKRLETLQAEAEAPEMETVEGDGWQIVDRSDINRIAVEFDSKPPRETCQLMRRYGFKFSRYEEAWLRHRNNAGRYAAECVARELGKTAELGR